MKETHSIGAILINTKNNKILVVSQHGTSWSLPKGHIEPGEKKEETLKREIYEESGITNFQVISFLGSYQRHKIGKDGKDDKSELKTIHIYLAKTEQELLDPQDPDNPEAGWYDKDKVATLLSHPKDKEFYTNALKQIPQKLFK